MRARKGGGKHVISTFTRIETIRTRINAMGGERKQKDTGLNTCIRIGCNILRLFV